jgi:DNA-binding CsgD family transcriptional regulator/tetratricopeptide (TPR) repeat protein
VITSGALCREFFGRSAEFDHLLDRALRSRGSRGAGVVVRGNAGIGKTRLVDEFALAARAAGAQVGIGRAREFANAPYLAISDALRALGIAIEGEAFADGGKNRHFERVAEAVAAAAHAAGPLVAIVEDLHWADSGTIELLRFLVARVAGTSALIVATYRSESIETDSARASSLGALEREAGDVVVLDALPDAVIERIVASALGDERARVPAETVSRIVELADGRPLFAEELLRGVLERLERDRSSEPTVPTSIRASVRERFASLNETDRDLLLHAAVVGRRFSARFLIALLDWPPATVFAALRRARDLQLVVEESDEDGDRFAFRHALIRESVYAELLRAETRILHGRVAEKLALLEPVDVAAAAEHFWRAGEPSAAVWNERAGAAAVAVHAYADAATSFERAFRVTGDGAARGPLAEHVAGALYALGETERSAHWYALAAEAHQAGGNLRRGWRLRLRHARVLVELGRYDEGVQAADRVATSGENADVELRFEAEVMVAGLLVTASRADEALMRLEHGAQLGAHADGAVEARYSGTLALTLSTLGRPHEARSHFREALERAREIGDDDLVGRTLNNYGTLELTYGRLDEARAVYRDGLAAAEQRKDLRHVAAFAQNLSLTALLGGELDAAQLLHDRSSAIEHGAARVRRWARALAIRHAAVCGKEAPEQSAALVADLELALRENDLESAAPLALALAAAVTGATAEASEIAGRIVAVLDRVEPPYWIVDAATRFGEPIVRDRALELIAAAAAAPQALAARGWLALVEARAALRGRRREEAFGHANRAAAMFREAGWILDEAYAIETAGRSAEALAAFQRIGATAEVRRLSGGAVAGRRRGEATLTAREREIASLLAADRSARAIADQLVISERTVETHVASVYRKLGVTNRRELSALLARVEAS